MFLQDSKSSQYNNVNKNKENQNLEVDLTFKIFNQKDVDNTIVSSSDCYINSG